MYIQCLAHMLYSIITVIIFHISLLVSTVLLYSDPSPIGTPNVKGPNLVLFSSDYMPPLLWTGEVEVSIFFTFLCSPLVT